MNVRHLLLAIALASTGSGCASIQEQSATEQAEIYAEGSAIGFGQSVDVMGGTYVVTPLRLLEDSRCPLGVRCVRAGELIVETRIAGPDHQETVALTFGRPHRLREGFIALASAEPTPLIDYPPFPNEYRFAFTSVTEAE